MADTLVVKATSGMDAPERCNQAFTIAAAAAAAGITVELWLTGEASWFAIPGRAEEFTLEHAPPLAELLRAILESGSVTLCTQCAARRGIDADDLVPGIRIAGAAAFVESVMREDVRSLIY